MFSVRGCCVRLRSGRTHRTENPKHPVRQRGFVQAGEQHRGGGEQDAQQEQLVLGCTARAEQPAGRGRSVSHRRCLLKRVGELTDALPVFMVDDDEEKDDQSDDDGHTSS